MVGVLIDVLLVIAPVIVVMGVAVMAARLLVRRFGAPPESGRLVSLDGLRGYLALGVFFHHATMWRAYVGPEHSWFPKVPVPLYVHIGESAVTVFFLMTGFLFGAKLAEGRRRSMAWPRLYVGRLLRIYPLHIAVLCVVLLVVAIESGFALRVAPDTLVRGLFAWMHFARPDLNGVSATWTITSGVTWSLAYEWLFYSALPVAALVFGVRPPWRWLVASAAGIALWAYWIDTTNGLSVIHLLAFAIGIATSVATQSARLRAKLAGPAPALAAIVLVALVPVLYVEPYQAAVLLHLSAAFVVIASGNDLFGLLRLRESRLLGEISYSIYMLHGVLLYLTLRGVFGMPVVDAMSPVAYCGVVVALAPVVVVAAFLSFRYIERPCIGATPHAQQWVAARADATRRALRRRAIRPNVVMTREADAAD